MRPEPFINSVLELKENDQYTPYVIMTSPNGNNFDEKKKLLSFQKKNLFIYFAVGMKGLIKELMI